MLLGGGEVGFDFLDQFRRGEDLRMGAPGEHPLGELLQAAGLHGQDHAAVGQRGDALRGASKRGHQKGDILTLVQDKFSLGLSWTASCRSRYPWTRDGATEQALEAWF